MTVPYTGEARQPNILAPCIIFTILSPLAVALRFQSRRVVGAGFWWDDWLVLIALPPAIGFCILMMWGLSVGFGAYPAVERARYLQHFFKALYTSEVLYNTSLPCVKASILLLYRRVFPTPWMTRGVWIMMTLNLLWFLATEPTIIFQCTPIRRAWNKELEGRCFNLRQFLLGQAISSIIIDFMTLLLPVYSVLSLNMPLKRRLMVCAIFFIGTFALACSIIRLPYILGTLENNTPYTDLYVFEPGNVWSLCELHVALVCACLPTIHPLFTRWRRSRSGITPGKQPENYELGSSGYRRKASVRESMANGNDSEPLNTPEETHDPLMRNGYAADMGHFAYTTAGLVQGRARSTNQEIGMTREVDVFSNPREGA